MLSDSFSCCILLKEAIPADSSSRLERPGPEPKKVHHANEQRERLRWILFLLLNVKVRSLVKFMLQQFKFNSEVARRVKRFEGKHTVLPVVPLDGPEPEEQCFRNAGQIEVPCHVQERTKISIM